tara:strand:- start:1976 stop:2494 length:519 start_codon:yes stop_codon:yes gene_type:complete
MILKTHLNYSIPYQILFTESIIEECHNDYLINKIEEGIKSKDNNNHWTNVKGEMTSWNFMVHDEVFKKLLFKSMDELQLDLPRLGVCEAWGFKINPNQHTQEHKHMCEYSGIFYLNDSDMTIDFPELRKSITCSKNKFLFFSGVLLHGTKPLVKGVKYGIAFNLRNDVEKGN